MESKTAFETFSALFHNLWIQRLLWFVGGWLWLMSVFHLRENPAHESVPLNLLLQGTMVDGERCLAFIDGKPVAPGQRLVTDAGVFRVQSIQPRRAILQRGNERIELKLRERR